MTTMMIAPPEALVSLFQPWNDFYAHSKLAETIVTFLHVGGVLLGGGLAIAADRGTLRALRLELRRERRVREPTFVWPGHGRDLGGSSIPAARRRSTAHRSASATFDTR